MIVGLRAGAEYMTRKGRPTTVRGLQTLLARGRHPGIGRRDETNGTAGKPPWQFEEYELDILIRRVRPYRRKVAS